MSVEIDIRDFERAFADLEAGLRNGAHQALVNSVKAAFDSARSTSLFQDRSGELRSSIEMSVPDPLEGSIRAGTKYARYVEDGTEPHDIVGKRGGMLRFVVDGFTTFRRRVRHPGTKPRPFMAVAAALGEQTLDYGLDYFAEGPIANFNGG